MATYVLRVLFVFCAGALAVGCGRVEENGADHVTASASVPGEPADTAADPSPALDTTGAWRPESRELLPEREIYLTLTDFEWYARGEPLLHEGQPYVSYGMPVAASVSEMSRTGEYEGVAYYTRRGDAEPYIYVPVFEGYWLVFRPDTLPTTAKSADPTAR